jgi:hypothetical protein
MVDLPPSVETVVEYIASDAELSGSQFARLFDEKDVANIDAIGKCAPDPIVYDEKRQMAFALFECRGELGHYGMAIQFSVEADVVKRAAVMTINQIGGEGENG